MYLIPKMDVSYRCICCVQIDIEMYMVLYRKRYLNKAKDTNLQTKIQMYLVNEFSATHVSHRHQMYLLAFITLWHVCETVDTNVSHTYNQMYLTDRYMQAIDMYSVKDTQTKQKIHIEIQIYLPQILDVSHRLTRYRQLDICKIQKCTQFCIAKDTLIKQKIQT